MKKIGFTLDNVRNFINRLVKDDSAPSQKAKRQRRRVCRIEELESREMLSVSYADFDTIKNLYSDLDFGNSVYTDFNIIEVGGAGDQAGGANNFAFSEDGLRAAIDQAGKTQANDIIVVRTTATQNTIWLTGDQLGIDVNFDQYGAVTIVSLGTNLLTISAAQECRTICVGNGVTTTGAGLGGMIIIGGNFYGYGGGVNVGGQSTLRITNSTITQNWADNGAGIANWGTLYVTQCQITGNTANHGGGGILNHGTMDMANSVVAGNRAINSGGGIYSTSTTILLNCTVAGNFADTWCGGINNEAGTTELKNTIVAFNNSPLNPPEIWTSNDGSANTYLDYCLLYDTTKLGGKTPTWGAGNLTGNPRFVGIPTIGNNTTGAWTGTTGYNATQWDLRLRYDSPAIDTGNNGYFLAGWSTDVTASKFL